VRIGRREICFGRGRKLESGIQVAIPDLIQVEGCEARLNDSHGNDTYMSASQAHANVAGRRATSDSSAGFKLAQMDTEAAQRSQIASAVYDSHGMILMRLGVFRRRTRMWPEGQPRPTRRPGWHRWRRRSDIKFKLQGNLKSSGRHCMAAAGFYCNSCLMDALPRDGSAGTILTMSWRRR
jgi:hypothetical protein